MADLRSALAPLGALGRRILLAVLLEVALLLLELVLTRAIGQHAIAAAMITAPRSGVAWLGAFAVLVRITAHAIFPAIAAFSVARVAVRHAFS